jgi:hypothetical protein
MVLCAAVFSLNALQIIRSDGVEVNYNNAELHMLEQHEFSTSREKDGVVRLNNWKGIRFDHWLKQQGLGEYLNIRFESADRYTVILSRAEFEGLESWLVMAQDNEAFANSALRIIFPTLREMQWIRDVHRIVLESFEPLSKPDRFLLMKPFLEAQTLHNEPAPFVNVSGWYFSEFLPKLSNHDSKSVVLYSRDGLKMNLEYPFHLETAVLVKNKDNTYDLKSPQIPGGMWIRDIIYLQCDETALIELNSINSLIALHKLLNWESKPDMQFSIQKADEQIQLGFSDALAEPRIFEGALYFELN